MNNFAFFKQQNSIKEQTLKIELTNDIWEDVEAIIKKFTTENGPFTPIHSCWLASLTTINIKIQKKLEKNYKKFSIKLKANEYFALKELTNDITQNDFYFMPKKAIFIEEMDKINR